MKMLWRLLLVSVFVAPVVSGQSHTPGNGGPDPANIPAPTAPTAPPAGVPMLPFHFGTRPVPPMGQKFGNVAAVAFTPDSRNLIICKPDEFAFWDLATLKPIRQLRRDVSGYPGHVAFSWDGKLMAMEMSPGAVHLKEVSTGRTIAKLEDPFADRATWIGFTPAGTELVVACRFAHLIHVWDLQAIRAGLKPMGLDWDWPEFPSSESLSRSR